MSIGSIQKIDLAIRHINAALTDANIEQRKIMHGIDRVVREGKDVLSDLNKARILEEGKGGGINTFA